MFKISSCVFKKGLEIKYNFFIIVVFSSRVIFEIHKPELDGAMELLALEEEFQLEVIPMVLLVPPLAQFIPDPLLPVLFHSIPPALVLVPPPPFQLTAELELDPPQLRAVVLDSVVTGVLNKSPSDEYLSPPASEGAVLAGGAADWAGVKLANPPFTAGAALAGVLDIGKREPVKSFLVFT